jgi:hypothetical protein
MNYVFDYEDLLFKPYGERKKVVFNFRPSFYVGSGIRDETKFGSGSRIRDGKYSDPG